MISKRLDKSPTHVRNYYRHFGYDESDFIACECGCGGKAIEIHHVEPRGMGGRKSADTIDNLVALTRECHNRAHGPDSRLWKQRFKEIIANR